MTTQYGTAGAAAQMLESGPCPKEETLASGPSLKDELEEGPEGFVEIAAPYVAEFAGTFLIVFTMGCCSICGDPMWNPTGVAFTVLVAVYSFFPISGGHLNPAITIALASVGKFKIPGRPVAYGQGVGQVVAYLIAQCMGGLAASLSYWAIFNTTVSLGPPAETPWQWYDVAMIEALYTFMMCFVFMNCITSERNNRVRDQNHFFALAVGFVYIAGGYPSLPITGSIFNPAASIAMGVTSANWHWTGFYLAGQIGGAWVASMVYPMVRIEDFPLLYTVSGCKFKDFHPHVPTKLLSEFIGTFLIVVTFGLNAVNTSPAGPWSVAASYTCLIYSLGDVSGGHFNPAVSLAVMLTRRAKISIPLAQSYILHQLGAGACAGLAYVHFDVNSVQKVGSLSPKATYNWTQLGMSETLFTSLLAFAFLAIATSTMPPSTTGTNFYFGLAIGSCITIGGFAIGAISGGLLNPAVSVGRALCVVINEAHLTKIADLTHFADLTKLIPVLWNCLWFSLGERGGGAAAAMVFFVTHQKEYLKDGSGYPHIP